jgi:hypothetical protein
MAELRSEVKRYWGCDIFSHRHRTEEVADRCIKHNRDRKPKKVWGKRAALLRGIPLAEAVIVGSSYKEAGIVEGISGTRARQIVVKVLRRAYSDKYGPTPISFYDDICDIRKDPETWLKRISLLKSDIVAEEAEKE